MVRTCSLPPCSKSSSRRPSVASAHPRPRDGMGTANTWQVCPCKCRWRRTRAQGQWQGPGARRDTKAQAAAKEGAEQACSASLSSAFAPPAPAGRRRHLGNPRGCSKGSPLLGDARLRGGWWCTRAAAAAQRAARGQASSSRSQRGRWVVTIWGSCTEVPSQGDHRSPGHTCHGCKHGRRNCAYGRYMRVVPLGVLEPPLDDLRFLQSEARPSGETRTKCL